MGAVTELNITPEEYRTAVRSVTEAQIRPEVSLAAINPPQALAAHAYSCAAEVHRMQRRATREPERSHRIQSAPTTGRFILLYDPAKSEAWGGSFRVVSWFRSHLDQDLYCDELLTDVSWRWLVEALHKRDARYIAEGGTAARTIEKGFGSLSNNKNNLEIEVRASWTPLTEHNPLHWAAAHLEAWCDVLCTATGLPPFVEGVTYL